jgi:hypothetical protein
MLNLLILTAGVAAIVWVNWYFFMAPKAAGVAKVFRTGPAGQGSGVKLKRLNHAAISFASRKSRRAWAGER